MTLDPLDRFKADLGDALAAYATQAPAPSVGLSRRHRSPRALAIAAVALAGAVVGVGIIALRPGSVSAPAEATAATVLRAAAVSALQQPNNAIGPNQYWYTDLRSVYPPPTRQYYRDRVWRARNGAGVGLEAGTGLRPHTLHYRARSRPFTFGLGSISYQQLRSLPTGEAALSALIDRVTRREQRSMLRRFPGPLLSGATGHGYFVFELVRDAFQAPTAPQLRSALFRVASRLGVFNLDGPMRDHLGRRGTALSIVLGNERFRMIVDTSTGQLLETQRIIIRRRRYPALGQRLGLYSRYTYVAARVVDHRPPVGRPAAHR
jgi:hypothetical protein